MLCRHVALTYHLSHIGSAELFSKILSVRTIFFIRIHEASFAIIKCRKEHWLYFQIGKILEYFMCCEWVIIVADTCMIPSHDKVRAAKILPHYCMVNCLFGSSVSHLRVKCNEHYRLLWIISIYQCKICGKNQFIFKVPLLFLTYEWVD